MAATAVVTEFRLRPMEAGDGPAMARLLREEAQTTRISLTTTYRHDVVTSLLAQHPTLFGVVAEVPGDDRLAGMANDVTGHSAAHNPSPLRSAATTGD